MENNPINENNLNEISQEGEKQKNIYLPNSENNIRKNKSKSITEIPTKLSFNLNSKYDNALLEELYNSKDKSWRNDISNSSPEKDTNNKKFNSNNNLFFDTKKNLNFNNIEINNVNNINNDINSKDKNDRFKDFDDILNLEDNRDKKRKNSVEQKLISLDKFLDIPKPKNKKRSIDFTGGENTKDKNLDIIEEVMEKKESNKDVLIKKEKEIDDNDNNDNIDKIKIDFNITKNSNNFNDFTNYLNQNTNSTNENNINRYNNVNLEYSEDKKTEEENINNNNKKEEKNNVNNYVYNNININPITNNEGQKTIKSNDHLQYIDIGSITPKRNKINIVEKKSKTIEEPMIINDNKKNPHSLLNTIEISKSKEKNKKVFIPKEKTNINLNKNLIFQSNTINHISLTKNKSSSHSHKNLFNYLIGDKNKNSIKNNNIQIRDILYGLSYRNNNQNKNNISNNIFHIKNLKKEINRGNNYNFSQNILNDIKINRIKNKLNNININRLNNKDKNENNNIKNNNDKIYINFFNEEKYSKTHREKNINKNNINKNYNYNYSEKIKNNKISFFPIRNNFIDINSKINNDNQKNEFIKNKTNNFFDMFYKNKIVYNNIDNKNSFFKNYSTQKKEKKTNSFYYNDVENDEFFINKKKNLNDNQSKSISNRNFNYEINKNLEINYNKIIDQLNNNLGIKNKNNNSFSSSNYKNSSSYYLTNNKNLLYNNYLNNKYNGRNFQKYIEKKGNGILLRYNNRDYKGYTKTKTSVLPANPFNSFNLKI